MAFCASPRDGLALEHTLHDIGNGLEAHYTRVENRLDERFDAMVSNFTAFKYALSASLAKQLDAGLKDVSGSLASLSEAMASSTKESPALALADAKVNPALALPNGITAESSSEERPPTAKLHSGDEPVSNVVDVDQIEASLLPERSKISEISEQTPKQVIACADTGGSIAEKRCLCGRMMRLEGGELRVSGSPPDDSEAKITSASVREVVEEFRRQNDQVLLKLDEMKCLNEKELTSMARMISEEKHLEETIPSIFASDSAYARQMSPDGSPVGEKKSSLKHRMLDDEIAMYKAASNQEGEEIRHGDHQQQEADLKELRHEDNMFGIDNRRELLRALHDTCGIGVQTLMTAFTNEDPDHHEKRRLYWSRIADHAYFHCVSISLIVVYVCISGYETNLLLEFSFDKAFFDAGLTSNAPGKGVDHTPFLILDWIVLVCWTAEICINMLAQGMSFWNVFNSWFRWNLLDVVCILTHAGDVLVYTFSTSDNHTSKFATSSLRILRVFRLVRVMRLAKVARFIGPMRKLVIAVSGALINLFWAMLLLLLFMIGVAMMLSTGLINFSSSIGSVDAKYLRSHFGNLKKILVTLYEAITGGDWPTTTEPLMAINPIFEMVFYVYIGFVLFGLLNVFIGIFVESATQAANNDRDITMQRALDEQDVKVNQIRAIFVAEDGDGDNELKEKDLVRLLADTDLKSYLAAIELRPSEAHGLFKLLDVDNSGVVSIEEFLSGCIRLKGTARALEMATMLYEMNKVSRKLKVIESQTKYIYAKVA